MPGPCPLLCLCPAVGEELSGGLRGRDRGAVPGTPITELCGIPRVGQVPQLQGRLPAQQPGPLVLDGGGGDAVHP